ncbi:UPF0157-domain-containing protein [Teratosphaeria nubilosa]|uniref:UPF0157-domain-containing protein n=1 Tax=Teratosphaeria nubilosa TaxID=161662 RepID=A0A6G1LBJ5_9PEZI|nr:UPF0157-domain-containing protein [Teratosphaeria nubilosa]
MEQKDIKDETVNGVPLQAILDPISDDAASVERIPARPGTVRTTLPIVIVEYDQKWPKYFEIYKSRIVDAFASYSSQQMLKDKLSKQELTTGQAQQVAILGLEHIGSTSVPGLPAKAVIDIDLVLSDIGLEAEKLYVPCLEAAGFDFRLREPKWHDHRFFAYRRPPGSDTAGTDAMPDCNLHVWGPRSPEAERHRIFRDWLRQNTEDRELYAQVKKECAMASRKGGEGMEKYTARKETHVREIMERACRGFGYVD